MTSDIIGAFASHWENRPRASDFAGARSWSVPRLRGRLSAVVDINHELRRTGCSGARNGSNGVLGSLRIARPRDAPLWVLHWNRQIEHRDRLHQRDLTAKSSSQILP